MHAANGAAFDGTSTPVRIQKPVPQPVSRTLRPVTQPPTCQLCSARWHTWHDSPKSKLAPQPHAATHHTPTCQLCEVVMHARIPGMRQRGRIRVRVVHHARIHDADLCVLVWIVCRRLTGACESSQLSSQSVKFHGVVCICNCLKSSPAPAVCLPEPPRRPKQPHTLCAGAKSLTNASCRPAVNSSSAASHQSRPCCVRCCRRVAPSMGRSASEINCAIQFV